MFTFLKGEIFRARPNVPLAQGDVSSTSRPRGILLGDRDKGLPRQMFASSTLRRPRRLIAVCALVGLAFLGVPLMRGAWASVPEIPPAIFDTFFGVGGFIIMGGACVWLWRRRRRDVRALAGTATAFAGVITLMTLRLVWFVQADYDRGRLPFAIRIALMSVAIASGLWWASARHKRDEGQLARDE